MYYIQSYKNKDFDFDYSTINNFSFRFKYTLKNKERVMALIEKVVKNNCAASKYITNIDLSEDKIINISLKISGLYCEPTGHADILETETQKKWIYEELEHIFKIYLISFHDKMKKKYLIQPDTLVLIDDKVYKYNKAFFENLYVSSRDKANCKKLSKMQLINQEPDFISITKFKHDQHFGLEFKTDRVSKKIVKMEYTIEKNISSLKKIFKKS